MKQNPNPADPTDGEQKPKRRRRRRARVEPGAQSCVPPATTAGSVAPLPSVVEYRRRDHYARLGVARHATPQDIKKGYRKMAGRLHPDRVANKSDAVAMAAADELSKLLNAANDVLKDPLKRAAYDRPPPPRVEPAPAPPRPPAWTWADYERARRAAPPHPPPVAPPPASPPFDWKAEFRKANIEGLFRRMSRPRESYGSDPRLVALDIGTTWLAHLFMK